MSIEIAIELALFIISMSRKMEILISRIVMLISLNCSLMVYEVMIGYF